MKTGSLRARVIVTTLAVLAIVLAAVVTATTLAYRAKLDGDLRKRLTNAGAAVERVRVSDVKPLVAGLALEGIATRIKLPAGQGAPATARANTGSTIRTHGSLLVLHEVLPDGTRVSFSASRTSIDHAVTNLLLVELLVAIAALALATLLVVQGTRTALRPLSAVIETAKRIARGDSKLRLNPSRTDTELGSLAHAFDQMVDALEAAIEEARASDAATRRFLADASHELRTPVAALQASVETLLREQPERPERDRLEAAVARESERLGRLVDDLLAGRIDVHLQRLNGYVQAEVADDGPGVPEHERQRIFERFVRLDPSKPGHGLGLAIARRIAQQHDGDLTCEPTASGASFTLRLPTEP